MILYLHGFRSSPDSAKARLLAAGLARRGLADQWCCPQLPASPAAALRLALQISRAASDAPDGLLAVIGSSLGGFYATWVAEQTGCRAIVLNPVVHAARDLATQVGQHRTFHDDQPFEFLPRYVDELAEAEAGVSVLTRPERYFLLATTGDEVLDWREMQARYPASPQLIVEGSDHGISGFEQYVATVLEFALPGQQTRS
ncbi:YqiA/YcfP family alpha/beta fold hydrolase [Castellaniella sp.]|uniref:YqiA/YcfP family alpha/beta fold hydrolase n=1 Tax=Castellaniella sp. TaxID=1955812 RepID=UPI00355D867B